MPDTATKQKGKKSVDKIVQSNDVEMKDAAPAKKSALTEEQKAKKREEKKLRKQRLAAEKEALLAKAQQVQQKDAQALTAEGKPPSGTKTLRHKKKGEKVTGITISQLERVRQAVENDKKVKEAVKAATETPQPETPKKKKKNKKKIKFEKDDVDAEDEREDTESLTLKEVRTPWKISSTLGGRFSTIKPQFSSDEKFLLVARKHTIQVYSTKTSLVVRTLDLSTALYPSSTSTKPTIVGFHFNPNNTNEILVATDNGSIFLVDWTDDDILRIWNYGKPISKMKPAAPEEQLAESTIGLVYVVSRFTEDAKKEPTCIYRVELRDGGSSSGDSAVDVEPKVISTFIHDVNHPIIDYEMANKGDSAVIITCKALLLGNRLLFGRSGKDAHWEEVPAPDVNLTRLAVYCQKAKNVKGVKKVDENDLVHVALGDVNGAIYVYSNVFNDEKKQYRKLHWHPKAVLSLAWSTDGNYLISGGKEAVLVIWQLDTSQKQFLPYLSGDVEDIVVSPRGISYALRLGDNSIIVLSTSELKPRASITGVQANVRQLNSSEASNFSRTPLVAHPAALNQILFTSTTKSSKASPFLQTFDTYSDRTISKQALARNNVAVRTIGPEKKELVEPNIEHMAISADGKWLATIDLWRPPAQDMNASSADEVYLKFWEWNGEQNHWELVTRVDSPHPSQFALNPAKILDLIALPKGQGFVTLGEDACVRIWKPRTRTRGGVTVRKGDGAAVTWSCRKVIQFSHPNASSQLTPITSSLFPTEFSIPKPRKPTCWGAVAVSRDGSLLAVSFPERCLDETPSASSIYLLDPARGGVSQVLTGLKFGRCSALGIVGRHLVCASDTTVLAWDLVSARVSWSLSTSHLGIPPKSIVRGRGAVSIAVDTDNSSFALSYNYLSSQPSHSKHSHALPQVHSRTYIFASNSPIPLHAESLPLPIYALARNTAARGFILLHGDAGIRYLTPLIAPHMRSPAATPALRSASPQESSELGITGVYSTSTSADKQDEEEEDGMDLDEDTLGPSAVLPYEKIAEIFDEDGGVEVGSLADRFERLVGALGRKALDEEGDEDEEERDEDEE